MTDLCLGSTLSCKAIKSIVLEPCTASCLSSPSLVRILITLPTSTCKLSIRNNTEYSDDGYIFLNTSNMRWYWWDWRNYWHLLELLQFMWQLLLSCLSILLGWLWWCSCLIHCGLVFCNIFLFCLLTLPLLLLYICLPFLLCICILHNPSINCFFSSWDTVNTTTSSLLVSDDC